MFTSIVFCKDYYLLLLGRSRLCQWFVKTGEALKLYVFPTLNFQDTSRTPHFVVVMPYLTFFMIYRSVKAVLIFFGPELVISKYDTIYGPDISRVVKILSHSGGKISSRNLLELSWIGRYVLTQTLPLCTGCTERILSSWPSLLRAIFRVLEWTSCPILFFISAGFWNGVITATDQSHGLQQSGGDHSQFQTHSARNYITGVETGQVKSPSSTWPCFTPWTFFPAKIASALSMLKSTKNFEH